MRSGGENDVGCGAVVVRCGGSGSGGGEERLEEKTCGLEGVGVGLVVRMMDRRWRCEEEEE